MFSEQLSRIDSKLKLAKAKDKAFKNFGSDVHRYELHPPINHNEVIAFENQHQIKLPSDFIAFITIIGHDGPGQYGGAGPYYGVYALGDFGYMVGNENTMTFPCLINERLTKQLWDEYTAFDQNNPSRDIEYYRKYDALFGGMLPLGTQGSSFQTMLILNGDYQGRVVSIDQDLQQPLVAPQKNFLDWYEQWLDNLVK